MNASVPALPPGARVDTLRIDRVLGHGAFGITYLVTDTVLASPFALKEFHLLKNLFWTIGWGISSCEIELYILQCNFNEILHCNKKVLCKQGIKLSLPSEYMCRDDTT